MLAKNVKEDSIIDTQELQVGDFLTPFFSCNFHHEKDGGTPESRVEFFLPQLLLISLELGAHQLEYIYPHHNQSRQR